MRHLQSTKTLDRMTHNQSLDFMPNYSSIKLAGKCFVACLCLLSISPSWLWAAPNHDFAAYTDSSGYRWQVQRIASAGTIQYHRSSPGIKSWKFFSPSQPVAQPAVCIPPNRSVVVELPNKSYLKSNSINRLHIHSNHLPRLPPTKPSEIILLNSGVPVLCFQTKSTVLETMFQWLYNPSSALKSSATHFNKVDVCQYYDPEDPRSFLPNSCPGLTLPPNINSLDDACGRSKPRVKPCGAIRDITAQVLISTNTVKRTSSYRYFESVIDLSFSSSSLSWSKKYNFQCVVGKFANCVDLYKIAYQYIHSSSAKKTWLKIVKSQGFSSDKSERWWAQKAGKKVTYKKRLTSYSGWYRDLNRYSPSLSSSSFVSKLPKCPSNLTSKGVYLECIYLELLENN